MKQASKFLNMLIAAVTILCANCLSTVAFADGPSDIQRMLLLPQNFTIGPGGTHTINARCVDSFLHTPKTIDFYSSAPTDYGSIQVSFGGATSMSLQQALDDRKLSIQGTGSFLSLRLNNLSGEQLTFSVSTPSLVAPSKDDPIDDLHPFYSKVPEFLAQDPNVKAESLAALVQQYGIWDLRRDLPQPAYDVGKLNDDKQLVDSLPIDGGVAKATYDYEPQAITYLDHFRIKHSARGPPESPLVIVYRIPGFFSWNDRLAAPAKYVVILAGKQPKTFTGNDKLNELVAYVASTLQITDNNKWQMVLFGEDVLPAQLTIDTLTLDKNGQRRVSFLKPPGGGGGKVLGGTSGGGGGRGPIPVAAERDDRKKIREEIPNRGSVTSLSYSEAVVSELASEVHTFLLQPDALEGSPDTILNRMVAAVTPNIRAFRRSHPGVVQIERRLTELLLDIDRKRQSRFIVKLQFHKDKITIEPVTYTP
ncbi:hypothetical protein [Reyranella sp.]|uniref:hypothetical protein n=1 Tax=Reyranella sp. TaxID=1929291 RepID=UPI003D11A14A